jgi:hypothetical protein
MSGMIMTGLTGAESDNQNSDIYSLCSKNFSIVHSLIVTAHIFKPSRPFRDHPVLAYTAVPVMSSSHHQVKEQHINTQFNFFIIQLKMEFKIFHVSTKLNKPYEHFILIWNTVEVTLK